MEKQRNEKCGIVNYRRRIYSSTEAKYIALSEVVKVLKFIIQLLETMNITVKTPITIYVDNMGAIWPSNNQTRSERTKHVHIRTALSKNIRKMGKLYSNLSSHK